MEADSQSTRFDESQHPINTVEFPYAEVDARLGNPDPEFDGGELDADVLLRLLNWMIEPTPGVSIAMRDQIAARVLVLTHATRPGLLGNPTLRELGENFGFEFRKLSLINADIRERFKLHTRSMKSRTAIAAYRARFHRLRNRAATSEESRTYAQHG